MTTVTHTITYKKMGFSATIQCENLTNNAQRIIEKWPDYSILKSDLIKRKEDAGIIFLQMLTKEIFIYLTIAGPSVTKEEVVAWFRHKKKLLPIRWQ